MEISFIEQVTLRKAGPADHNFVLNSWLKSLRTSMFFHQCPDRIYFENMAGIINHLIKVKETAILCPTEHQGQILAFLCYERIHDPKVINTVYFAYTKKTFRMLGAQTYLFAQLLGDDPTQYTFATKAGNQAAQALKAIYNPFIMMR